MKPIRYKCLVPDCENTIDTEEDFSAGWVCKYHFAYVDREVRRAFTKRKRRFLAGREKNTYALIHLWDVIKDQATKRSQK